MCFQVPNSLLEFLDFKTIFISFIFNKTPEAKPLICHLMNPKCTHFFNSFFIIFELRWDSIPLKDEVL